MPYIAFDLDALADASNLARAAGIAEDTAIAGLARLWAYCWRSKTDVVDQYQLAGFFGGAPDAQRVGHALAAFGFLEVNDTGFRVRGAEKYLRISSAKAAAGRVRAASSRRDSAGRLTSSAPAASQQTTSSEPALTLSIEHRTSNRNTEYGQPFFDPQAPTSPNSSVTQPAKTVARSILEPGPVVDISGPKFFAKCQHAREQEIPGVVHEPKPPGFDGWWPVARSAVAGNEDRLFLAYRAFLADAFWRTRKCPFGAFIAKDKWREYVPAGESKSKDARPWVGVGE